MQTHPTFCLDGLGCGRRGNWEKGSSLLLSPSLSFSLLLSLSLSLSSSPGHEGCSTPLGIEGPPDIHGGFWRGVRIGCFYPLINCDYQPLLVSQTKVTSGINHPLGRGSTLLGVLSRCLSSSRSEAEHNISYLSRLSPLVNRRLFPRALRRIPLRSIALNRKHSCILQLSHHQPIRRRLLYTVTASSVDMQHGILAPFKG